MFSFDTLSKLIRTGASLDTFRDDMSSLFADSDVSSGFLMPTDNTVLTYAACFGHMEVVKELVETYHVDVNAKRKDGKSPLLLAVYQNQHEVAKYLAKHNANPDVPNKQGSTPLHVAAEYGNVPRMELLLQCGARLDLVNNPGDNPLSKAIRYGPQEASLFLLHQKISPIPAEMIDECTKLASDIGMASVVLESLRMRNGSKFTNEVETQSSKLVRTRAIASRMNEMFVTSNPECATQEAGDRECNCAAYCEMKRMVLENVADCCPFSDDMLLTILTHAKLHHPREADRIWAVVLASAKKCVEIRPRDCPQFSWFEEFLAPSAVWYESNEVDETTTKFESSLVPIVEASEESFPELTQVDLMGLSSLSSFSNTPEEKKDDEIAIRQDEADRSMQAEEDPIVARLLNGESLMTQLLTNESLTASDLRLLDAYDKHVYIARLMALCEGMRDGFEAKVKRLVADIGFGHLKTAPVKALSRAIEKIGTDYSDEMKFPRSGRILDLLRCSITFVSVDEVVEGVRKLFEIVTNDGDEMDVDGIWRGIARCKNGFADLESDGYKDVKLNLIYYSKKFDKSVVTEVQCILESFLIVKKNVHRTYALLRKQDVFGMVNMNASHDYADKLIYNGARFGNAKKICHGLLMGGNINRVFAELAGETALITAARNNQHQVISLLLEHGADPEMRAGNKFTALRWAEIRKFDRILEILRGNAVL